LDDRRDKLKQRRAKKCYCKNIKGWGSKENYKKIGVSIHHTIWRCIREDIDLNW
jgi:hypothetical protein